MIKYLLLDYNLLLDQEGEEYLDSLTAKAFNPTGPTQTFSQEFDKIQTGDNFKKSLIEILNYLSSQSKEFNNVMLVAPSMTFFSQILEQEFKKRTISMPYILENYLDLQNYFRKVEGVRLNSINDMAEHFNVMHLWGNIAKMKAVIRRLHEKQKKGDHEEKQGESESSPQLSYCSSEGPLRLGEQSSRKQFNQLDCNENHYYQFKGRGKRQISPEMGYLLQQNYPQGRQNKFSTGRQSNSRLSSTKYSLNRNAVRVRGMPFSYDERMIYDLLYDFEPLPDGIKMGNKGGAKNGQAVVLFKSDVWAERALRLHNSCVEGRFLQVMLISYQSYLNFK